MEVLAIMGPVMIILFGVMVFTALVRPVRRWFPVVAFVTFLYLIIYQLAIFFLFGK